MGYYINTHHRPLLVDFGILHFNYVKLYQHLLIIVANTLKFKLLQVDAELVGLIKRILVIDCFIILVENASHDVFGVQLLNWIGRLLIEMRRHLGWLVVTHVAEGVH